MRTPPKCLPARTQCSLYLITPPVLAPQTFTYNLNEVLNTETVSCVQLRLKDVSDDTLCYTCDVLRPIVQKYHIPFILNDRPELVNKTGCDGVHIGQQDTSYKKARAYVGQNKIIGVTCHDSRHLGLSAVAEGADYIAFGAFFRTSTKPAKYKPKPHILTWWSTRIKVPCVAIGGITSENCAPLVRAGANFLAVLSAVWYHPEGPKFGAHAINTAISQCLQNHN